MARNSVREIIMPKEKPKGIYMKFFNFLLALYFINFKLFTACSCWQALNPGDEIALIAPSGKPSPAAITTITQLITKQSYVPVAYLDESASGDFNRSDTLEHRRNNFLRALQSNAKVILCLRGGNGASGIFKNPRFFESFSTASPKLICGFSDGCALHFWANSIGWPSLHGILGSFCLENDHAVNAQTSIMPYFEIFKGNTTELSYDLVCENTLAQSVIIENSQVIGGNLSLIQRAMGTPRQLNTRGRILFIEDIHELGRKINEMLSQLQEASLFDEVRAVIWGTFISSTEEQTNIETAKKLLAADLNQRNIPFFSAPYFGHGTVNNPLPFNTSAKIEAGGKLIVRTNNN